MRENGKLTTVLLLFAFICGLSVLLYPSISNYWNLKHTTHAISVYSEEIAQIDDTEYKEMWQEAVDYNTALAERIKSGVPLYEAKGENYDSVLKVSAMGVMGYIEIESIGVSLPVYHGTADTVLQSAVGHIDWSSLPVGGESSHCILSGHRGLPSARLFTDLDALREGDTFTLNILNDVLTYQVDQIRIVMPTELSDLDIVDGKDYCTLVTCTPYGINTHRLLVRGHRVETEYVSNVRVISEAVIIEPLVIAPMLAFPILIIIMIIFLLKKPAETVDTKEFISKQLEVDT